ncbi:MAG: hypothetical protein WBK20_00180 [Spirochaetota bacterium]
MKRFSIIILFLIVSIPLYANDLSIGISGWYADWKMVNADNSTRKMDPVLYLGPSIAYQFSEKWSVTFVGLVTAKQYEMTDEYETTKIRRYDNDLALNYQLHRFIKIFAGAKYLGFTFKDGKHYGAGPGGGIGVTIPLVNNFYMLGNASLLYLWGTHEDNNPSKDFTEFGYNVAAQIAYYAASLGVTASLGYRYQYFKSRYDTDEEDEHTFKGFTVLLVKSFHWE